VGEQCKAVVQRLLSWKFATCPLYIRCMQSRAGVQLCGELFVKSDFQTRPRAVIRLGCLCGKSRPEAGAEVCNLLVEERHRNHKRLVDTTRLALTPQEQADILIFIFYPKTTTMDLRWESSR
jgi:hypothetical protein